MAEEGRLEEGLEGHAREGGARHEDGFDGQLVCPRSKRGRATGPNPTDRAKKGSKRHVITDSRGLPLAAMVTGADKQTRLKGGLEAGGPGYRV